MAIGDEAWAEVERLQDKGWRYRFTVLSGRHEVTFVKGDVSVTAYGDNIDDAILDATSRAERGR